ncbi:hypothetical protein RJ641_032413 [Dillenia turbinata]|uniref:Uncharacterized protein n=1 Tax=Dillenia turbinata TaxID=194707 RepID=A0AAN8VRI6_9MAGN
MSKRGQGYRKRHGHHRLGITSDTHEIQVSIQTWDTKMINKVGSEEPLEEGMEPLCQCIGSYQLSEPQQLWLCRRRYLQQPISSMANGLHWIAARLVERVVLFGAPISNGDENWESATKVFTLIGEDYTLQVKEEF